MKMSIFKLPYTRHSIHENTYFIPPAAVSIYLY